MNRAGGTLGEKSDVRVRAASGLKRIGRRRPIAHDHVSVPADFGTGKALLDRKP